MGLDLSFLLGGGGGVQMPDPVRAYGSAMSLAQLARQNRLGDVAEREATRKLEEDDAYRAALPALLQAGFSREAVLQAIQADPRIGQRAVTEADARQKSEADLGKTRAATFKDSVEAKSKAMDDIAAIANAEASKPNPSLSRVKRVAEFYGVPLPPVSGDDPESLRGYIQSLADAGISVKDQIAVKQKDRDFTAGEVEKMWRREFDTGKQASAEKYQQGTLANQAADRAQRMIVAKMGDDRARDFNAITQGGNVGKGVIELRKEFNSLPEVKNYKATVPIINSVRNAPDTAIGDLDVIYGVGKILDPESVVREGELALTIASGSPMERMLGQIGYVVGRGRMTPDQRKKIIGMLQNRVGELENSYKAARFTYEKAADSQGLPKDQIFIETPSTVPAAAAASQTFDKIPPASQYPGRSVADDQGNVWRSDGKSWSRQ